MLSLENQNQSRTLSGLPLSRRLSIPGSPAAKIPSLFIAFFFGAFLLHDRMAKGIDPAAAAVRGCRRHGSGVRRRCCRKA